MDICGIVRRLPSLWYQRRLSPFLVLLLPLSWVFGLLVRVRRRLYGCGLMRSYRLSVPVVVVGNLTVGGAGKTPLVLWLVERLKEQGWRPGIISRGYRGAADEALAVTPAGDPSIVGDEPILLARRGGVPVFVGRDRVGAGRSLLSAHPECDVLVSDDGLQHYRLQRSVEIAVFDGRGAGNGRLLPAGPLREPLGRLSGVDALVWNRPSGERIASHEATLRSAAPQFEMHLVGLRFRALHDANRVCTAADLQGKRLFAMAGIGDPGRFFRQLESMGLEFEKHPFPDHHAYLAEDLAFAHNGVLLMTEKDAVKCAPLLSRGEAWVLPVEAQFAGTPDGKSLFATILEKLDGCTPA
jgi:tetraacyldisaccharide 4'-kinase